MSRFSWEDAGWDQVARAFGFVLTAVTLTTMVATLIEWDSPEFGRHPDEAAHFITGTMVGDWFAEGLPWPPLEYARHYYASYPRVALGHWPPFFYLTQGLWYTVFGVSRISAMILVAALGSGYLILLFEFLRRWTSPIAALAAIVLVWGSPAFRVSSSLLMADLPVALLSLAAMGCYIRYLGGGSTAAAFGFGLLSSLAILTKQDAIALGVVPPLSLLILRRWDLVRDWRFYMPGLVVVALCCPFYLLAPHSTTRDSLPMQFIGSKAVFLARSLSLASWSGLSVAAIGIIAIPRSRWPSRVAIPATVLASHALGFAAIFLVSPVSSEVRFGTALLAFAALLAATGLQWILSTPWGSTPWRIVAATTLVGLLIAAQLPHSFSHTAGYRALVGGLQQQLSGSERQHGLRIVLVCSDSRGDGAIISEFRLQHPSQSIYLLRADKVLAHSTWNGLEYQLVYSDTRSVENYLETQPVHYVILDSWGTDSGSHHGILSQAIESDSGHFPLLGTYPIVRRRSDRVQWGEARLYAVASSRDRHPSSIDLQVPVGSSIRVKEPIEKPGDHRQK